MPEKKSSIKWFLNEIPRLKSSGTIGEPEAASLESYYRERLEALPSPLSYFMTVLSIVGGVLISGGIIMLLNYNWDMFGKSTRIAIAGLPLLLGAVVSVCTLAGNRGQVWREFSAILTSCGASALIALLSQIYHTGGQLHEFMMLVLLISLPFIYIFNSIGLMTLYTVGLFMTLGPWSESAGLPLRCILLAGVMPYVFFHLETPGSHFRGWMRYIVMFLALFGILCCTVKYYVPFALFAVAATFLLAGWNLYEKQEQLRRNPWIFCSFILLLTMLGIGSSTVEFWRSVSRPELGQRIAYWLFTGGVLIAFVVQLPRRTLDSKRMMMLLLIVLAVLPFFCAETAWMRLAANIYMGVFSAVFLLKGAKKRQLLTFNGGLLMLVVLIACRFFDSDIGLLARGLGFIVLGVGFICANRVFTNTLKKEVKL